MLANNLLRLRAVEPADVDRLYIWENSADAWLAGDVAAPMSRQQLWDYANHYDADPFAAKQLRLMVEVEGETIGAIDLYDFSPRNANAFVGILVDTAFRGKGYGQSALLLTERYAADVLGIHTLCALVSSDNETSARLFESCDYGRVGTLRQWLRSSGGFVDAHLYQKIIARQETNN